MFSIVHSNQLQSFSPFGVWLLFEAVGIRAAGIATAESFSTGFDGQWMEFFPYRAAQCIYSLLSDESNLSGI